MRLVDNEWLEYDMWDREKLVELPDELYLRELRDLDPSDPTAVRNFVAEYGRVSAAPSSLHNPSHGAREAERFSPGAGSWNDNVREVGVARAILLNCSSIWQAVAKAQASRNPLTEAFDHRAIPWLDEIDWQEKMFIGHEPYDGYTRRPYSPEDALHYLAISLYLPLRPFHLRVDFVGHRGWREGSVSTYSAMCLQLFNHIQEGNAYAVCANERCQRPFVRQRDGRGHVRDHEHHGRVGGVKYCSRNCANAQTQRDYRRRKKNERSGG